MTPNDRKLWHWFVQYVTPLKKKKSVVRPIRSSQASIPSPSVMRAPSPPPRIRPAPSEPILAPLDRKLRRDRMTGRAPLNGTLDLHGMTQDQAYQALTTFLDRAFHDQKRFVLIITGKGKNTSPDSPSTGVLKRNLPLWLGNHDRFPYILFLKPAARLDGGDGAWYVGLKKNRSQR